MHNIFDDKKQNNNYLLNKMLLIVDEIREQNKLIIKELSYIKKDKEKDKVINNKSKSWFY